MSWTEKQAKATVRESDGHKLTITLFCHSPQADALKIWALANHPDIEKLYVIPCFEQVGNEVRGFSAYVHHNLQLFGTWRGYWRESGDTPHAVTQQVFSGYEAKARIAAYQEAVAGQGDLANWLHGTPASPVSQKRKDIQDFITAALSYAPHTARSEEEVEKLSEQLHTLGDLRPIEQFGHCPISFADVAASDLICCDVNEGFDILAKHFPRARFLNRPHNIDYWGDKTTLPELASATDGGLPAAQHAYAGCWNISTVGDLDRFAEAYGEPVVLKDYDSKQGHGIYKATRRADGMWTVSYNKINLEPAYDWLKHHEPVLAMQWLQPKKGDVRVLCLDGEIIGAYNRLPKTGSELCNRAQGGYARPYELTHAEAAMLTRASAELAKHGQRWVGFDLLADEQGRRYISEVNLGNIGGIDTIHDFSLSHRNQKPAALALADAIVGAARNPTPQRSAARG